MGVQSRLLTGQCDLRSCSCDVIAPVLAYYCFKRSEVVGRPLAALLANDGARVFSVDIDSIQEYTKRPWVSVAEKPKYHAAHIVHSSNLSLGECLALSDVVVSAVPNPEYKVKTEWIKPGSVCVNVASEKNFEGNVREKVYALPNLQFTLLTLV